VATFYLSSVARVPRYLVNEYHLDWILHGVEYGVLCLLMLKTLDSFGWMQVEKAAALTIIAVGVIGALNELVQAYTPYRSPSLADGFANVVGAAVFMAGYFLLRRRSTAVAQLTDRNREL